MKGGSGGSGCHKKGERKETPNQKKKKKTLEAHISKREKCNNINMSCINVF
jgi:hypothetical protein